MKYEYREVKCPRCSHVFMWNKNGRESHVVTMHRIKENGKYVEEANCPKCEMKMLVLDKIYEGIDINDERIEHIGVRGI